jgi:hypothetical protein
MIACCRVVSKLIHRQPARKDEPNDYNYPLY